MSITSRPSNLFYVKFNFICVHSVCLTGDFFFPPTDLSLIEFESRLFSLDVQCSWLIAFRYFVPFNLERLVYWWLFPPSSCFHLWFEFCYYIFDKVWPDPWPKLYQFLDKILVFACQFCTGYQGYHLRISFISVASTIFHACRKDMLLAYFTDRIFFPSSIFGKFLNTLGGLHHSLHICEFSCIPL